MVPTKILISTTAQLFSKLTIIISVSRKKSQHIRMISKGSCNTEDWRNDAEILALITEINYILKFIVVDTDLTMLASSF